MLPILFLLFSLLALVSALGVIMANNPVNAVLLLVLTFVATAMLWMLLQAEFLSLILIVVYVGAVMVLFLFVVMMLNVEGALQKARLARVAPWALLVPTLFVLLFLLMAKTHLILAEPHASLPATNDVTALGNALYTDYLYPVEIAGVILLIAMIAAIMLTLRHGHAGQREKRQKASHQVNSASRLKLIKDKGEGA